MQSYHSSSELTKHETKRNMKLQSQAQKVRNSVARMLVINGMCSFGVLHSSNSVVCITMLFKNVVIVGFLMTITGLWWYGLGDS